jgi:hypothetical protein
MRGSHEECATLKGASMFLVPYRKVEVISGLSSLEIHSRLFRLTDKKGEFDGRISPGSFRIYPNEITQNVFLPHVHAELKPHAEGTQITLRFVPGLFAWIFLPLFFVFFEFDMKRVEGHLSWIPVGFFVILYVILYFAGFLPEQRKIEKRLREVFDSSNVASTMERTSLSRNTR